MNKTKDIWQCLFYNLSVWFQLNYLKRSRNFQRFLLILLLSFQTQTSLVGAPDPIQAPPQLSMGLVRISFIFGFVQVFFISIFIGVLVFRQRSSSHFQATRCQNSQGCAVRSDFGFSLLIANIIYGKFGKLTLAFSGGTSGRCLEPYVVLEVSWSLQLL